MKKPKFGIVIAIGKSPMGEAYKKAAGKYASEEKDRVPKAKMPNASNVEKDPKKPKSRMPIAPKSGKPSTKPRRSGKEM